MGHLGRVRGCQDYVMVHREKEAEGPAAVRVIGAIVHSHSRCRRTANRKPRVLSRVRLGVRRSSSTDDGPAIKLEVNEYKQRAGAVGPPSGLV